MGLVERIKTLCDSKDTTLIGLERKIGIGRGTIRKWNDSSPSTDKLQKVADYFNASTDYLLGKTEFKNINEAFKVLIDHGINPGGLVDDNLGDFNVITAPETEDIKLISRINRLTPASKAAVIALVDNLEIIDAQSAKEPKKKA